jgi:hypothetical protein
MAAPQYFVGVKKSAPGIFILFESEADRAAWIKSSPGRRGVDLPDFNMVLSVSDAISNMKRSGRGMSGISELWQTALSIFP